MKPTANGAFLGGNGIFVLPVLHERLEYADLVRGAFAALDPDAVVVEIPSALTDLWLRGVDRLPAISVLLYENAEGQTIYLPIAPSDAMAEAARRGRERGVEVRCGDLDLDGYADYRDPVPDGYALLRLGPEQLYRAFRDSPRPTDPLDDRRESAMAHAARCLRDQGAGRVLVVCGMHHAASIARAVEEDQGVPLTAPRRRNARLVNLHPDSLGEVLQEIPFYLAAWEARRIVVPEEPEAAPPMPAGRTYGTFRVLSGGSGDDPERLTSTIARAARRGASAPEWWTSWVGNEIPSLLDRLQLQWSLVDEAERALGASAPDERIERWQRPLLARYTRNLALASGTLVADLFDLLTAARGCVSENFAWELHRLAVAYPAQETAAAGLATARIHADELWDGVRRMQLSRRIRKPKRPDLSRLLKTRRRDESRPGEWLDGFDSDAICSWPPEDVIVEEFGRYLRRRGKSLLSEERTRTAPFTTSILDGIDVRETIRNWTDGRIMVREFVRAPGNVGSVVVIFEEDGDPHEERFPYAQTWHGEHSQESDMAFYSTDPALGVVGPGICRATYGGFMLSHPPRRMADVWSDPDYRLAESKAEVLLLAALDYTTEKITVYVAPRPPRPILRQLAARLGLRLLHVPLGSLSPVTRRRLRVLHILSGADKRKIAREYIW